MILAAKGSWLLADLRLHHYWVRRLPLETRAGALGGFTPLAHGTPEFYVAQWTAEPEQTPTPFRAEDNVPAAKKLTGPDVPDGGKP